MKDAHSGWYGCVSSHVGSDHIVNSVNIVSVAVVTINRTTAVFDFSLLLFVAADRPLIKTKHNIFFINILFIIIRFKKKKNVSAKLLLILVLKLVCQNYLNIED